LETAQIIGEVMGITPVSTCGLREWHLGELEGQYSKELWKSHFEIMNCFSEDMGDVPVPGGESRYTFEQRVAGCIEDIADKSIGKTVVIVTHTGTMHSIFKHIVGPVAAGNLQPMCSNVSVSKAFRLADGKWRLRSWNDICHLDTVRNSETF
jgi:broad specificity phosphatase PhoE